MTSAFRMSSLTSLVVLIVSMVVIQLGCFPKDECRAPGIIECDGPHAGRRCYDGDYQTEWNEFECPEPFECVENEDPSPSSSNIECAIGGEPHPICEAGGVCDEENDRAIDCSGDYAVGARICTGCTRVSGEAECEDFSGRCTSSSQCPEGMECLYKLGNMYCSVPCEEDVDCAPFFWPADCLAGLCY